MFFSGSCCITFGGLSNVRTWFYHLTANLPLVLGHRINLEHFLQVNLVGLSRLQRQLDRGAPGLHG